MNEVTRVCQKCGVRQPSGSFVKSKGYRERVCKRCRNAVSNAKNRDDWPPMPEIMKNQYWRVTQ